jgi:uncharacterized Zn-binding protein involved in type VI secretion
VTGVAVKGKDRAGGKQAEQAHDWFRLDDDPVVTVGDTVEPHGTHAPAPTMVEGESWFRVGGRPVCRAENKASCGHATTGRQWFRLTRADSGYRPYLTSAGDPCNIEHIPWIMRANGWYEGAKLMDQWFSNTASTVKKPEDSDTTTITMDWVLELDEAQRAYDELMNEALWTVPNGDAKQRPIDRLCDILADKGYLTTEPTTFDFQAPVWKMKGRQFDNRVVRDGNVFIFDKHGAALGVFELLLVAAGEVEPLPDRTHQVTIRKKGVFMEDQYDFEGAQYFGFWNIETHTASLLPSIISGCKWWVDNGSFRKWRDKNKFGGDYLIYSDLKQITLENPYVFYCPTGSIPN